MTEVVIDFNIDLAKRIKNGEIAGSFITDKGNNAEFVYISKKKDKSPLLFVEEVGGGVTMWVREDGTNEFVGFIKIKCDIRQAFKDGDVLASHNWNPFLFNGMIDDSFELIGCHCGISLKGNLLLPESGNNSFIKIVNDGKYIRFATKEEKEILIDKLMVDNSEKARSILSTYFKYEVFNKVEKLKPFDKVLVRNYNVDEWRISLFHKTRVENGKIAYQCCGGKIWDECLPYEGNERLLYM